MMTTLDFDLVRRTRAQHPERIIDAIRDRRRSPLLREDRLLIIAADHTARGVMSAAATSMSDRYDLLERLATALRRPGVDGVLATADIIADLAVLGLLDDRILVTAVNRGGLAGSVFEVDDRTTGSSIRSSVAFAADATKMLIRIDDGDERTAGALERAARTVDESASASLPILLEPFLSSPVSGSLLNQLDADSMIRAIAIASGLGGDSSYSWLKLPVVGDMERVMRSTTLPTLLLGGDPSANPANVYESWGDALALPGVRGLVVGRSMLYPVDGDVAAAVDRAAELVHAAA
jgi:hypothetical protein